MGFLKLGSVSVVLAGLGCYEPELRDCTVTCNAETDCASGHVCGADKFCAAPEIAGQCSSLPGDAGAGDRDAGVIDASMTDVTPDAAPPPDAATHAVITITIAGKGRVAVIGVGTCDAAEPQDGACRFAVPFYVPVTMTATAYEDWRFDRWTTSACAVVPISTCSFTPSTDTPVGVKFKKDD